MYAIVRAGGRQEKVSVGDVLLIDKIGQADSYAEVVVAAKCLDRLLRAGRSTCRDFPGTA